MLVDPTRTVIPSAQTGQLMLLPPSPAMLSAALGTLMSRADSDAGHGNRQNVLGEKTGRESFVQVWQTKAGGEM